MKDRWIKCMGLFTVAFFSGYHSVLLAEENAVSAPVNYPNRSQNITQTLIMLGVVFLFFYFILWRPEKKKQKSLENKRNNIRKGDGVVTIGGILGTVLSVGERSIVVQSNNQSEFEVLKSAVSDTYPGEKSEKEKKQG